MSAGARAFATLSLAAIGGLKPVALPGCAVLEETPLAEASYTCPDGVEDAIEITASFAGPRAERAEVTVEHYLESDPWDVPMDGVSSDDGVQVFRKELVAGALIGHGRGLFCEESTPVCPPFESGGWLFSPCHISFSFLLDSGERLAWHFEADADGVLHDTMAEDAEE